MNAKSHNSNSLVYRRRSECHWPDWHEGPDKGWQTYRLTLHKTWSAFIITMPCFFADALWCWCRASIPPISTTRSTWMAALTQPPPVGWRWVLLQQCKSHINNFFTGLGNHSSVFQTTSETFLVHLMLFMQLFICSVIRRFMYEWLVVLFVIHDCSAIVVVNKSLSRVHCCYS